MTFLFPARLRHFSLLALLALFFTGCSSLQETAVNLNPVQPDGPAKIVIDLGDQKAWLYRGGTLAAVSRISSGREGYDTPAGRFKVIQKDAGHASSIYGAYVSIKTGRVVKANVDTRKDRPPPGTRYVGAPMPWFLRFQGAHGLHQGNVPRYPASHGCIRLPGGMAKRFYQAAKIGTPVIVKR